MGLSATDKLKLEEFERAFLSQRRPPEMQPLCEAGVALARRILEICPDSRRRDVALEYLDDALIFAHAAFARQHES